MTPQFPNRRQPRDDNHRQRDRGEMLLDPWLVAKPPPERRQSTDPKRRSEHVVGSKTRIAHLCQTGHEGRKGSNERNKAGHDDGHRAMTLVKRLGPFERVPVKPGRALPGGHSSPQMSTDAVVECVAHHRSAEQQAE